MRKEDQPLQSGCENKIGEGLPLRHRCSFEGNCLGLTQRFSDAYDFWRIGLVLIPNERCFAGGILGDQEMMGRMLIYSPHLRLFCSYCTVVSVKVRMHRRAFLYRDVLRCRFWSGTLYEDWEELADVV